MKRIEFMGWRDCVEIESGDFRLIVTTEVGPRIIGAFIKNSPNLVYVDASTAGSKGGDEWNIYGGHRLWHSPEEMPRTYIPDNKSVNVIEKSNGLCFSSGTESKTGIHKSFYIEALGSEKFRITHHIRNENLWDVELAAWALTVMAPGGVAVVPQTQGDVEALLANRSFIVWPYTDMSDSRLTWGRDFVLLRQDSNAESKCKYGCNCEPGWLAYVNSGRALVKKFEHLVDAEYPDNGCSVEVFTNEAMLEIETLSPLYQLAPGEEIQHVEEWQGLDGLGAIKSESDAAKYFENL